MLKTLIASLLVPLALLLTGSASGENPQLIGTVGTDNAFVITLTNAAGENVTRLDPGTYTLLVRDRSAIHNFHFAGPGVDVSTTVAEVGEKTFTVTLTDGIYTYQCDPHSNVMGGVVDVGNPPPPPPPPPPATKSLAASVTPSGTVSLSKKTTSAGTYRISVRDRSHAKNFHLVGPGVNRKTTAAFVGTVTWKVELQTGTYRFGSDPKLTGRLKVT
jgi:plastocyanin